MNKRTYYIILASFICFTIAILVATNTAQAATFTNIASQPSPAPGGTIEGTAYSPDGTKFAVGASTGMFVYNVTGTGLTTTYTNITAAFKAGNTNGIRFSPDNAYLCAADTSAQRLHIYETTTWTDLGRPPHVNASATDCEWSPDGTRFAVATTAGNTSALRAYNVTSPTTPSTWTLYKTNNDPTSASSVAWDSTSSYLASGRSVTPFFVVFHTDSVLTALSNPAILPTQTIGQMRWGVNELAMTSFPGGSGTQFMIYSLNAGSLVHHTNLSACAVNGAGGLDWVLDEITSYVVTSCSTSTFRLYSVPGLPSSGDTYTQITGSSAFDFGPFGTMGGHAVDYSGLNKNLAVGSNNRTMIFALNVPQAPINVTANATPKADGTGACVNLTWEASGSPTPTGYSVFYKQSSSASATAPMNNSAYTYFSHTNAASFNACGLLSVTDYHFRVIGTTSAGEGVASSDFNNTTVAGQATFVVAQFSNNTMRVNWSIGPAGSQGQTGFSIFYNVTNNTGASYPMNSTTWTYYTHVNYPSTLNVTVLGLAPTTTYCFRVEGTNASAHGEGDIRTTTACALTGTGGSVPFAPVLTAVMDGDGLGATLTWTTPTGTILGYNVTRTQTGGPRIYAFDSTTHTMHVHLFDTNSSFTVHAWNGAGNSDESNNVTLKAIATTLFDQTGPGTFLGNTTESSIETFGIDAPNIIRFFFGLFFVITLGTCAAYLFKSHGAGGGFAILGIGIVTAVGWWPFWVGISITVLGVAVLILARSLGAKPQEA